MASGDDSMESVHPCARATGGSIWLKPGRQRKPKKNWNSKKVNAVKRLKGRFSLEELNNLRQLFKDLTDTKAEEEADGIIMTCMNMGMSTIEMNALLNIGTYRITRLRKRVNLGTDYVKPVHPRSHKFPAETILFLKEHMKSWEVEDGFPCPHRRPRQYLLEEGITWFKLWKRYTEKVDNLTEDEHKGKVKAMAYSTFTMYTKFINPGLRLTRAQQDVCDSCIRLNLIISCPTSTEEQITSAQYELQQHNSAARDQRRVVSKFTRKYALGLDCTVPEVILPDHLPEDYEIDELLNDMSLLRLENDEEDAAATAIPEDGGMDKDEPLLLVAEDYGQGIALPWFGFRRPGSDYFQSNLMLNMFVVADISKGENNVILYDERLMGKNADALCSLRMAFHINHRNRCLQAGTPPQSTSYLFATTVWDKTNPTQRCA